MIDNQFIKKPSGFNKQRLDSFVKSVKTNKQDVQKKELDEALALHTQLVAKEMMQRAMQLPAFPDLQQAYINQGMQQMQPMQQIPQAAYGMEIGAVMPSISSPFTYPSQQNLTPPNSDMFKKNADKYEGKGMSAFKNLFTTAANAVLNPAIQEYNQKVYNAKQKAAENDEDTEETDVPGAKMGGDLPKAQIMGTTGSTFGPSTGKPKEVQDAETALQENLDKYQSDEPVYDNQGNLITKEQLQQATRDAYNAYYQAVGQAVKDNPTPSFGGPGDMSYMYNYPTRDGLNLPNVNVSGPGVTPELYNSTAAAQKYTNMGSDYPGLGAYIGLSPQRRLESNDMNYSPNYKAMYNDALSKGQYDRFETNITANPTVAGSILDKLGVGKMFATRNYDINQSILPEGQSIFDPERLEKNRNQQILNQNANSPAGGLFETDQLSPDLWQNISRGQRRGLLNEAGIDPNMRNLRGMGRKFLGNEAAEIAAERGSARPTGGLNIPGVPMPIDISGIQTDTQDASIPSITKLPSQSAPKGSNAGVVPTLPKTGPDAAIAPVVTTNPAIVPNANATAPAAQPFYNTKYDWDAVQKENAEFIKRIGQYEITKGSALGSGLLDYTPLTTSPEQFYNWTDKAAGKAYDYSGHDQTKARWKGFDANALPADLREAVLDQSINQGQDPRLTLLLAQGIIPDVDRYDYHGAANVDKLTTLFNDPKTQEALSKGYSGDNKAFINKYLDTRLQAYRRTNPKGFDSAKWNTLSNAEKNAYLETLDAADAYGYTWEPRVAQYRKQKGGSQLPSFKGEYGPSTFGGPGPFGIPGIFGNNKNGFNNFELALGLKTDNPFMVGTQDDVLNNNGFDYTNNGLPSGYVGANENNSALATATGSAKIKSNIAPTTYLTMANTTGKYLADNIFGRDERKRAQEQYKKSRFLENNLALTSPDTQFDPRLRGFDRTTDAFAGAPYAGAQVQYSQPLIAMGQRGTEIPITMQEGGVYTLTPEMIKQIIENGGEIEYVDESNNFANPFNQ